MSNTTGGPPPGSVRPSRSARMNDIGVPPNVRGRLPPSAAFASPPSHPPPPVFRGAVPPINSNSNNSNTSGRRDSYGSMMSNNNIPHNVQQQQPSNMFPPPRDYPPLSNYQGNSNNHGNMHVNHYSTYGHSTSHCPPGFMPLADPNPPQQQWFSANSCDRSVSDEYHNYYARDENNDHQHFSEMNSYRSTTGMSQRIPGDSHIKPLTHPRHPMDNQHRRVSTASAVHQDQPRMATGDSPSPVDEMSSRSLSGDGIRLSQQSARHRLSPQSFHALYLRQILAPGSNKLGQLQSSQLHLEFLSHLQGIMTDIVPGSRFRLHGGMASSAQIRACPIELSWELPPGHGNPDPLRALSNALRRQQPTPLKYLFKCISPPNPISPLPTTTTTTNFVPYLMVTDLVSQLTCHLTLNNTWGALFSSILASYTHIHPVVEIATQSILHWAVKCGISTPPPPVNSSSNSSPVDIRSRATSVDNSRGSIKADGSSPSSFPTHTNLSVILVLWIRFLIEKYPQVVPATELLVDHLDVPCIEIVETVDELLLNFFEFYRSVDFSTSVISIRSGAPPLNRLRVDQVCATVPSALVVIDPIIDRNLSGIWPTSQVASFIRQLQIIPFSNEVFYKLQPPTMEHSNLDNEGTNHLMSVVLKDADVLSQWLVILFNHPFVIGTPQPFESVEDHYCDHSLSFDAKFTQTAAFPANNMTSMCERDAFELPTVEDLNALRLVQNVLSDKVRFLRNEVYWKERHPTSSGSGLATRRERTESCASGATRRLLSTPDQDHWTSAHFSVPCKRVPLATRAELQDSVSQHPQQEPSSIPPMYAVQIPTRSRLDTMGSAMATMSSTSAVTRPSFESNNKRAASPGEVTTTTGSTPPVKGIDSPPEQPQLNCNEDDNGHEAVDNRLNDAVAMLLELTGYPREFVSSMGEHSPRSSRLGKALADGMNAQQHSHQEMLSGTTQHTPSSEYLSALMERHFGSDNNSNNNWNLGKSKPPKIQHLVQELLRDYPGTPLSLQVLWSRIECTPFYAASSSLINVTKIQRTLIASFLPAGMMMKGLLPEAFECSTPVPAPLALIPSSFITDVSISDSLTKLGSIMFSVSWDGAHAPRIGTLRVLSRSILPSSIPEEVQFIDPQYADMSNHCRNTQSPLLHFSLNPSNGSLFALDDDGNRTHLLFTYGGDDGLGGDQTESSNNHNDVTTLHVPLVRTPEGNRSKSEMIAIVWKTPQRRESSSDDSGADSTTPTTS